MVHNNPLIAFILFSYCVIFRKRFIYRITQLKLEEYIWFNTGIKSLLSFSLLKIRNVIIRRSFLAIFMSNEMKNFMVSTYSLNPSSCHVLVSTVSVQPIVYSSQISSELQIAKSSLHVREWVVYIGDIKASRDVGTLIKIFVKKDLGYDVGCCFGVGNQIGRTIIMFLNMVLMIECFIS